MTPDQAIARLWRHGDLSYLLHPDQEDVRARLSRVRLSGLRIAVVLASRRWGKDRLCSVLSVEHGLQKEGSQVRYAAPTQKMVRTIIEPHMQTIMADAPGDLRFAYRAQEGIWQGPGGSQIHTAGTDNGGADRLRGVATDLGPISEAGYVDDLDYLVNDVLIPQTATTEGFLPLVSSPSVTPAHPFAGFCARAERDGALIKRTIHDAPHISEATREELCFIAGGKDSTTWRREYLCEFVADETLAVLPEFSRVEADDAERPGVVKAHERPPHYVPIIVADVGYHDLTFVLFGYHDWKACVDVVEAEYVTKKSTSDVIVEKVNRIASDLWGEERARAAARYADAPPMTIAELGHPWRGIAKKQTDGTWKSAVINDVRSRLADRGYRINPECRNLVAHCRYAVWRDPGRMLERMDGFGHFDGVDALAYFTRLVDRRTNPYPARDPSVNPWTHHMEPVPDRANLALLGAGARRQ